MRASICERMPSIRLSTASAAQAISVSITSVSRLRLDSTRSNSCIMYSGATKVSRLIARLNARDDQERPRAGAQHTPDFRFPG